MSDYLEMLQELGLTDEQVRGETERGEVLSFDISEIGLSVEPSTISGNGVFARQPFAISDAIGPASLEGVRTPIGRFLNHSDKPNAMPCRVSKGILIVAVEDVNPGNEITVNYREMLVANKRYDIVDRVFAVDEVNPLEKLKSAERFLMSMPQTEVEPDHVFADGIYSRGLFIPAGHWITGKVHKQNDLNVVVYGHMKVLGVDKDGSPKFSEVRGGCQFAGKAGVKKIGFAYEDTYWITAHHTHLTGLSEIEKELFEEEESALDFVTGKQISGVLT